LRLLHRDINKRISLEETKSHPFFKSLNFEQLLAKKVGKIALPVKEADDSDD
jgi:hypothetical protein